MQVVGFQKSTFQTKDKTGEVTGYNIYCVEERDKVTGHACERIFATEKKLDGYVPVVGDTIKVVYNKYGKVDVVLKVKQ